MLGFRHAENVMRLTFLTCSLALTTASPLIGAAPSGGIWVQIYSTDLKVYAQNMHTAGLPKETVVVLISQEINERFRQRERALQPSTITAKSLKEEFSPERREALVQLRIERNQLTKEVLGSVPQEKVNYEWSPRVLDRLSPAERETVRAITDDYDAMIARVNTESRGFLLEEDREKIRFLEIERANDLRKVLSRDEVLDFELAETSFGRGTRNRLKLFEPTPDQLRTYLHLAQKNDMAYGTRSSGSEQLGNVRRAFEKDLAAAWDAETYARYRRTTSAHFSPIHYLVKRLNLDPQIAIRIYESTRITTESGARYFQEGSPWMTVERPRIAGFGSVFHNLVSVDSEREKAGKIAGEKIKALVEEHCTLVRSLLGEAGYKEYFDFAKGWIEGMRRGNSVQLDFAMYQPGGS